MELSDDTLAAITLLLSGERLGTFLALAGSPRPAIALHQQTLQVAGTLMCVTAVVEIALRNTICDHLANHFGTTDWLRAPPAPFGWRDQEKTRIGEAIASAQRAAYTKMDTAQKRTIDDRLFRNGVPPGLTHERHAKIRQQSLAVPNGQVIAQLTLYFWKRLFSAEYESPLWRPVLKRVFPDKTLRRADVAVQLERIYQTRNRIAHHEPVYGHRLHDTLEAIAFIVTRLGQYAPCHATPLAQLLVDEWRTLSAQAAGLRASFAAMSPVSSVLPAGHETHDATALANPQ
ncbi:hypothetical protein ACFSHT_26900 [Paraburkholderia silviterrae]|uniref:Abi-like protein n=1 Tax=Paraburkholderia silviterrae TaxID=2528715 RepID=A0A4R5M1N1_9BURK|nr:hypothetical protein [Paraburkholderia silviterrae]TDG19240.1 hypothetical protein EYW47_31365 [Paraburkholderia silviterrae]